MRRQENQIIKISLLTILCHDSHIRLIHHCCQRHISDWVPLSILSTRHCSEMYASSMIRATDSYKL